MGDLSLGAQDPKYEGLTPKASNSFRSWLRKFALVVAGPFVPEPFGFVARTMLNSLLSMLTEEAEQDRV